MTFEFAGKSYSVSDVWCGDYVRLPNGTYLVADFVDGKPQNIRQRKVNISPKEYLKATEV